MSDQEELSNLLYLWPRRTLFVGRVAQPIEFSQAAASLVVAVGAPMVVHRPDGRRVLSAWSLLLAPGTKLTIDTGGQLVAACYLDALRQDHQMLAGRMTSLLPGVHGDIPGEEGLRQLFEVLHQSPLSSAKAYRALEQGVNPDGLDYPPADPRIVRVIERIREQIAHNLSIEELASEVNLSVSRLVELFRGQVGVPIRRYRQWHRLFVTFAAVNRGESLTDAAIAAGFTDSAHFSHTFRMTLGMTPSDILSMLSGRMYVDTAQSDLPEVIPGDPGSERLASST